MAQALLTGTEACVDQGRSPLEGNCRLWRAATMACDTYKEKASPFRRPHALHASPVLGDPLSQRIAAPERLCFTLSQVAFHSVVGNAPASTASQLRAPALIPIADIGDARKGLLYAQQVCAGCHNVLQTDAASPNRQAPAFKTVANTPGMSITALTVWSRTSHPTMPNLVIEPADMDDLIAYILSLRDR